MIELIAAMTKNGCIGKHNTLLWKNMKDDMKSFVEHTKGKAVIMGRKTFESLNNKPLPNRLNIIVSTTLEDIPFSDYFVVKNLEEALTITTNSGKQPIIIGGGQIYSEAINLVDVMYLTTVDAEIEGDTFFPKINSSEWNRELIKFGEADERNEYAFTIYKLTRI